MIILTTDQRNRARRRNCQAMMKLVVHNTEHKLTLQKRYKLYLRDIKNPYLTFDEWNEKYGQ